MAVAFSQGATLQRGDLNIFLTNANGAPQNAFSITFSLYYVDPGPPEAEVLIGAANRTPVNPAVGEYYASVQIPGAATAGDYRIRWDIVEFSGSPTQQVVQEFAVLQPNNLSVGPTYTGNIAALINSLRILLRDQCVAGEEVVELDVAGERMLVRMDELWDVCGNVEPHGQ